MKRLATLGVLFAATGLGGCVYAPPLIYGKVLGPVTATSEAGPASKTGRACSQSILGIAAFGDGSINAAKRAGGITTVVSVDFESTNVLLGIYSQFCTVVKGN